MNIIVEGPDNVGKSTLIRHITKELNDHTFHTIHYSSVKHRTIEESIKYSSELYDSMFQMMKFTNTFTKSGIICDRAHLGEMVYSPLYRDYSGLHVLNIEEKHLEQLQDNTFLILLVDEPLNLISRDDGLSFSNDVDQITEEIKLFKQAYMQSNFKNKLCVNIDGLDEIAVKKFCITVIKDAMC